ncbi:MULTISPECIES: type II toxin-antitoxin system RelE/ParE family toxin [Sedimentibacter]|uniref:Type II toxin-antitoxin system RelE/ParE family toxin n=1 Tax=Sedimentibacter hydroxybenzoicus DSM 7310 TaxID=1123245 RepID=A0A974GV01_SEDHY|nr:MULTISPECIES: type II toxin-antitoxin system RelE/ParE family toxin [Sedimentibacter]NYB72863.1 type II toxin-antitoxin system RelE/ParE family toxin [Sedimentibacter hydroxybenzoicus DSM 7310]
MKLNYSKDAIKFLKKQNKIISTRIIESINRLPSGDVKKLQGKEEYRLRVGSFRIVFTKEDNELYIKKIDNRGQVYK